MKIKIMRGILKNTDDCIEDLNDLLLDGRWKTDEDKTTVTIAFIKKLRNCFFNLEELLDEFEIVPCREEKEI